MSANAASPAPSVRTITLAHSPDSDDAFMFYALAKEKISTPGLRFEHTLADIETLNRCALAGRYDVTAISFHAYPYLQQHYALLTCGGSVGEGYGPMVVARSELRPQQLAAHVIAVPGAMTTAYLALKLCAPQVKTETIPFDQIIPQVVAGKYSAGLIIHEGQLTFAHSGLRRVLDLGEWWRQKTGLPLPLGGNAIRRALGRKLITAVAQAMKQSIEYALAHRPQALAYAMQFARDLDPELADRFVGMYVNQRTLDYGQDGRRAIRTLLQMGYEAGIIPHRPQVEFAA